MVFIGPQKFGPFLFHLGIWQTWYVLLYLLWKQNSILRSCKFKGILYDKITIWIKNKVYKYKVIIAY